MAEGVLARITALERRYDVIEQAIQGMKSKLTPAAGGAATSIQKSTGTTAIPRDLESCEQDTPEVAHVRAVCRSLPLLSAKLQWVPSEYYSKTLQWRRDILGAPSIQYLCKTIVLENTHCVNSDCSVRTNSRYYMVIFQYVEKFDSEMLMRFIKGMNESLGKKKFNFRLADGATSQGLTGFGHNAVVPIGTKCPIPVVLSEKIVRLSPAYFWLGGGHADCKLRVDVEDFIAHVDPFVADFTTTA